MRQDESALHLRPDESIDCDFYVQRSRERWSMNFDAQTPKAPRRMKIFATLGGVLQRVLHPA